MGLNKNPAGEPNQEVTSKSYEDPSEKLKCDTGRERPQDHGNRLPSVSLWTRERKMNSGI